MSTQCKSHTFSSPAHNVLAESYSSSNSTPHTQYACTILHKSFYRQTARTMCSQYPAQATINSKGCNLGRIFWANLQLFQTFIWHYDDFKKVQICQEILCFIRVQISTKITNV